MTRLEWLMLISIVALVVVVLYVLPASLGYPKESKVSVQFEEFGQGKIWTLTKCEPVSGTNHLWQISIQADDGLPQDGIADEDLQGLINQPVHPQTLVFQGTRNQQPLLYIQRFPAKTLDGK